MKLTGIPDNYLPRMKSWSDAMNGAAVTARPSAEALLRAVMELMRFVAMAACMPRIAASNFEWHGKSIRKGDALLLMIASANYDPAKFIQPGQVDFTRPSEDTMTVGPGVHHCVNHLLAKMEVTEFLPRFLRRFPAAHLPENSPTFTVGLFFRGIETLPLALV